MIEEISPDLAKSIEQFKDLLKDEPDLDVRTDDNFILRHIRAADGDPEKAFEKLKAYYQLKRDYPEYYATEPPIAFKDVLEMGCDYVLEDRDPSGKRIWVTKLGKLDTSKTNIMRQAQMHDLILETILDEPETQKNGMAVIIDLKDFPWSLLKWFVPSNIKVTAKKADVQPFPKIDYHVVNTSILFNIVLKISYPFLSTKQKESLFIHGDNWSSLHEKLDPSILPEEYGGLKPSIPNEKLHAQIFDYSEKLQVNLNLGYRSKKPEIIEKEKEDA